MKDLFRDLLIEIEGLKYPMTLKFLLSKQNQNGDIEFSTVYFNSTAKTVINTNKYVPNKSVQQVFYRIDNWINEGSTWTIDYIEGEYINVSIYNPLSESITIIIPNKVKNSKKGLINVKNNDNKCFLWYHIRHLNPLNKDLQGITKVNKKMDIYFDYKDIEFPFSKKDYKKIEQ